MESTPPSRVAIFFGDAFSMLGFLIASLGSLYVAFVLGAPATSPPQPLIHGLLLVLCYLGGGSLALAGRSLAGRGSGRFS